MIRTFAVAIKVNLKGHSKTTNKHTVWSSMHTDQLENTTDAGGKGSNGTVSSQMQNEYIRVQSNRFASLFSSGSSNI